MTNDTINIEVFYPYSVQQVWTALTDSEALSVWLMVNDFEPHIGHRFTFTAPGPGWSGLIHCEVVAVDHLHRVAYTWRGEPNDWETLVTFTLEPAEGGTRLQLVHSGFEAGAQVGFSARDMMAHGWNSRILREKLPALLAEQTKKASPA